MIGLALLTMLAVWAAPETAPRQKRHAVSAERRAMVPEVGVEPTRF